MQVRSFELRFNRREGGDVVVMRQDTSERTAAAEHIERLAYFDPADGASEPAALHRDRRTPVRRGRGTRGVRRSRLSGSQQLQAGQRHFRSFGRRCGVAHRRRQARSNASSVLRRTASTCRSPASAAMNSSSCCGIRAARALSIEIAECLLPRLQGADRVRRVWSSFRNPASVSPSIRKTART